MGLPTPFLLVSLLFSSFALSQYPRKPEGLQNVKSKLEPGVSISYKQTHICETTPGVKAYSGYVHLPGDVTTNPYELNTFFWFFESRNNPKNAPLSIYLGGGPGQTSLYGATLENGPCYVNPDGNSTTLNPWSFNNNVNMLYIDQPNFAGYSYDVLVNGTIDHMTAVITPEDDTGGPSPPTNLTTYAGTFPSQKAQSTANSTTNGARSLWHFMQAWVSEFPQYEPNNDKISLWANSYGGFFGETYFSYFQSQNKAIEDGKIDPENATKLHLDTLGVTNGCLDTLYEAPMYPEMAFKNSYGLETIPEEVYQGAAHNVTKPGGCLDLINQCRELQELSDPEGLGTNQTVNQVCVGATQFCFGYVQDAYVAASRRSAFDISHALTERFPPYYASTFFNQGWVQSALGSPVNHTYSSSVVTQSMFGLTGDPVRRSKKELERILDNGIKVALVFGDLDYRCNWLGAENVSLNLNYDEAKQFRESGYTPINTNDSYIGGLVRQYGNLSFSRVYLAGHAVSAYQPETAYKIFSRAMFDKDVATGTLPTKDKNGETYQSKSSDSDPTPPNEIPSTIPPVECTIWAVALTCTPPQIAALQDGSAVVKNNIVVSPDAGNTTLGGGSGPPPGSGAAGISSGMGSVVTWLFGVMALALLVVT